MKFAIVFNILEISCIYLFGLTIDIKPNMIAFVMLLFFLTRFTCKKPLHYNKWYICALWSFNVFALLFVLLKADIYVSILSTVFTGYVTSGTSNIDDLFMFKKQSDSKYIALDQFIKFNYDDSRLIKYENYLKEHDVLKYNLYTLRFRNNMTLNAIEEQLQIFDRKKIISELDSIYEVLKYNLLLKD